MPCLPWSHQLNLISEYPELAGGHSYCRNPGGKESQPWCYVAVNNKMPKEFCIIPKCGKYGIYIYILIYILSLTLCDIKTYVAFTCS